MNLCYQLPWVLMLWISSRHVAIIPQRYFIFNISLCLLWCNIFREILFNTSTVQWETLMSVFNTQFLLFFRIVYNDLFFLFEVENYQNNLQASFRLAFVAPTTWIWVVLKKSKIKSYITQCFLPFTRCSITALWSIKI